jgi:hypothetical protein
LPFCKGFFTAFIAIELLDFIAFMAFIALGISCWESLFPEAPKLLLARQPSHKGTLNRFTAKPLSFQAKRGCRLEVARKIVFFYMVKYGEIWKKITMLFSPCCFHHVSPYFIFGLYYSLCCLPH